MTAKAKQMSPGDSAWLHMEDPTNLMMITGVSLLDKPILRTLSQDLRSASAHVGSVHLLVAGARYAQRCPVEFGVAMEAVIAA